MVLKLMVKAPSVLKDFENRGYQITGGISSPYQLLCPPLGYLQQWACRRWQPATDSVIGVQTQGPIRTRVCHKLSNSFHVTKTGWQDEQGLGIRRSRCWTLLSNDQIHWQGDYYAGFRSVLIHEEEMYMKSTSIISGKSL